MPFLICSWCTKALKSFSKKILYCVSYTPNCNAHVHVLNDIWYRVGALAADDHFTKQCLHIAKMVAGWVCYISFLINLKKRVTTCLGLVCLCSSVNHSMYIQGKAYEAYVISYLTRKFSYRPTVKNNRCKRIYDNVRFISLDITESLFFLEWR